MLRDYRKMDGEKQKASRTIKKMENNNNHMDGASHLFHSSRVRFVQDKVTTQVFNKNRSVNKYVEIEVENE